MHRLNVGNEIIVEQFANDMMASLELRFEERLVHCVDRVDNFVDFEHILFMVVFGCFGVFAHNIYL